MGNFISPVTDRATVIAAPRLWIEGAAIQQLAKTVQLPGMVRAVGMPDLHPGKGAPIGAAMTSTVLPVFLAQASVAFLTALVSASPELPIMTVSLTGPFAVAWGALLPAVPPPKPPPPPAPPRAPAGSSRRRACAWTRPACSDPDPRGAPQVARAARRMRAAHSTGRS